MNNLNELLRSMTFDFFGSGKHKIEMEALLAMQDAVFLDVRSRQEYESLQIRLEHHIRVLWIPIDEIPDRYAEIPRDQTVGIFCSAGTRSTIVYLYLRSLGYENVRIAPSNYDAITSQLMPGKLYKAIQQSQK
ncbi:sulfurtransferase [Ornatilinea apprima]|uniref:Sulfurtransferase n=1 Tax=Ornatilinea apprima TaxID=1134406 RepID=A0A0P6WMK0_9CHLR|nr:rhodanese-like domain-containing protein [Ornatilinea apprima]KPL70003.1 sulfurtransferase [Ornatilinea apprima]